MADNVGFLLTLFKESAGKFCFSVLHSVVFFCISHLNKVLEMVSFGCNTCITVNKDIVYCMSDFCWGC
jgi:hypothetical protein